MLDYTDLNEDEKRTLRDYLGVERIFPNYLEDHNILIMKTEELFEYIFLYDLKNCQIGPSPVAIFGQKGPSPMTILL